MAIYIQILRLWDEARDSLLESPVEFEGEELEKPSRRSEPWGGDPRVRSDVAVGIRCPQRVAVLVSGCAHDKEQPSGLPIFGSDDARALRSEFSSVTTSYGHWERAVDGMFDMVNDMKQALRCCVGKAG